MDRSFSEEKINGATFTPMALAYFLAKKLIKIAVSSDKKGLTALDPSCGNGILLHAMQHVGSNCIANLIGYDTNEQYLKEAKALIEPSNCDLYNCDFLTVCPNNRNLFNQNTKHEFADIVIANPPYVRTQILGTEKARQLAHDFGLTGRIDLYYPFLMAMTNALKKGGLLGVITSNRYLSTKSGSDIRKYLLDNYDLIELIDLGDTKLFNAAVLPAILIGKKKENKSSLSKSAKYVSIYESESHSINAKSVDSIYDILENENAGQYCIDSKEYAYKTGLLKHSLDKQGVWQISNDTENKWIEKINENTAFVVKDLFKVRVGVKSCADNVFLNQEWENEGYIIEDDLLRPMISQENINQWRINKDTMLSVLYPHCSINGKRDTYDITTYPSAFSYLQMHRKQLEGRSYLIKAGRKWYEYWVPQNPTLWSHPKIVFPDISIKPRFCYDDSGAIVNGNCYWICTEKEEEKELLFLIEGVANSEVMIQYHDLCFNNKLYSGRRRFLAQYIEQYPMPDPKSKHAQDIIKIVKEINFTEDTSKIDFLTSLVNDKVKLAFNIQD